MAHRLMLLLLLASVSARVQGDCEFPIRRSRMLSSWQYSFDDGPTCFYNRSHSDEESTLKNKIHSYRFFYSQNKLQADGGFHWFAVQLNETVLIRSVTVKGREASSEHQVVAENSSFSVSCSLHCNGSELCSNSSGLQLCFPNGSCTADKKVAVAGTQPHHSGNYTCKVGSVETQTSVTVLYPPSKVFITLNFKNCQNLSDLTVQFTCSASVPVPEHSCIVEADGAAVKNLTHLSQSSSRDGSVSQWKLDRDEEQSLESRVVINCSAVQQLPHFSFRQDTIEVNYCSDPSNASSFFGVAASIICGVGLSFCAALIVVVVLRKTQCREPSAVSRLNVNSTYLVNCKLRVEESPLPGVAIGDSEPECSYFTVEAAAPAGLQAELQDTASDCTEFIAILADGE